MPPLVYGSITERQEHNWKYLRAVTMSHVVTTQSALWFTFRQGSASGSPVPARGDAAGKTCPMTFRLLGSRSTGGIALRSALRSASTPAPCSARDDDSTTVDVPSPPPPTRNENREPKVEGRSTAREGGDVCGLREGGVEEGVRRRADTSAGGNAPSPGRGETSGLLVSTGPPVLNVSDWSLQSCDDADDGAVSEQRIPSGASTHEWTPHFRAKSPHTLAFEKVEADIDVCPCC